MITANKLLKHKVSRICLVLLLTGKKVQLVKTGKTGKRGKQM